MQDYEVMVHEGLGSDKVLCGGEFGDLRSSGSRHSFHKMGHLKPKYHNTCPGSIDSGKTASNFLKRKHCVSCVSSSGC